MLPYRVTRPQWVSVQFGTVLHYQYHGCWWPGTVRSHIYKADFTNSSTQKSNTWQLFHSKKWHFACIENRIVKIKIRQFPDGLILITRKNKTVSWWFDLNHSSPYTGKTVQKLSVDLSLIWKKIWIRHLKKKNCLKSFYWSNPSLAQYWLWQFFFLIHMSSIFGFSSMQECIKNL